MTRTTHRIAAAGAAIALALGGIAATAPDADAASKTHGSITNIDGNGDILQVTDIRPGRDRTAWVWPGGRSGKTFDVDRVRAVRSNGKLMKHMPYYPDIPLGKSFTVKRGHHTLYVRG